MGRVNRTLVVAGLLAAFGPFSRVAAQVNVAPASRPVVGAIRWDAWTEWAGENRLGPYEACLGPAQWHSRLPFYAEVISAEQVEVRGDRAEVMDQEIAYAAAGGLDYWAFDWYHAKGWKGAETMSAALDLYLASSRVAEINYCLILLGGVHLGPKAEWPETVDYLVQRFRDATYQTVLDGRPLVYIFDMPSYLAYWGDESAAKAGLELLRERSREAGAGDPYVALMVWSPGRDAHLVADLGADALSAYVNPPGADNKEEPYSYAVALNRWFWSETVKAGVELIPTVTSGWDYRPMKRSEFTDRNLEASWITQAKPEELADHVRGCLEFIRQNPETCPAAAAVVYAWNEFAEGGWLCPTLSEGTARLDAIAEVLRPQEP